MSFFEQVSAVKVSLSRSATEELEQLMFLAALRSAGMCPSRISAPVGCFAADVLVAINFFDEGVPHCYSVSTGSVT